MEVTKAERFKGMKNTSTILPTRWHHNLAEAHKIVSFLIRTPTYTTDSDQINNLKYDSGEHNICKVQNMVPLHYQYWHPYSYPINNFN